MRSWSRFRPSAVADAPESSPVDELVPVLYRRDLPTLIEHLSTGGANTIHVGGILPGVTHMGDLFMHNADQPGTLGALNPVVLCAGRLGGVTGWRGEVHGRFLYAVERLIGSRQPQSRCFAKFRWCP